MPLPSGASFAGYTLVRLLGSGELTEVYLAQHPLVPGPVALTVLPANAAVDIEVRQRFVARAAAVVSLDHPHILRAHDHGEFQGWSWVAADYVDGPDCSRLLDTRYRDGMPGQAALTIVTAVASALDYGHQHGVDHGDVKPANIELTQSDSSGSRGILLDYFGSAYVDADPSLRLDAKADQSALAATTFQLLTGSAPNADTPLGAQLPPELAPIRATLVKAQSDNPRARFGTSVAFAEALSVTHPESAAEAAAEPPPAPAAVTLASKATTKATTKAKPSRSSRPKRRKSMFRVATVVPALLTVLVLTAVSAYVFRDRWYDRFFHEATPSKTTQAAASTTPTAGPLPPAPPACGEGQDMLAAMSLRDKLAQLVMVGVKGPADARKVVTDHHVGGIFIGSWTDLSILSDGTLPQLSDAGGPLPLAVSVDEEGGRVERLASLIGEQQSPRVLTKTMTLQEVHDIAFERGQKMRKLGITIDFAPVVDVTDEPDDDVIGDRSFGSDPETVTEYAGEYAKGLREAGLLPVLKHFPGHGHGSGDSHTGGVSTPPLSDLEVDDLIPYHTLTTEGPVAVMVGHLDVPGLTTDYPASLSPEAYSLLRSGDYGGPPFDGPVFTDDLSSMRAISDRFGVAEAALRALQAGADVALWVTTDEVPAVLDRLESAVHAGELNQAQVDASVLRVASFKGKNPHCGG
ncbi:MAG: beta-glucosidase-like glycosyl hydrolase [Mycobacterium sp.]|nr:beta-glucosidase-like glycosyl hydrolase [Mycobacterium sp.]